jgi:hypothetical protein
MQLALANAQSGLTALEHGRHAAKYAEQMGRAKNSIKNEIYAYEVFAESPNVGRLENYFRHLVAIHAAPREHWAESGRKCQNRTVWRLYAAK